MSFPFEEIFIDSDLGLPDVNDSAPTKPVVAADEISIPEIAWKVPAHLEFNREEFERKFSLSDQTASSSSASGSSPTSTTVAPTSAEAPTSASAPTAERIDDIAAVDAACVINDSIDRIESAPHNVKFAKCSECQQSMFCVVRGPRICHVCMRNVPIVIGCASCRRPFCATCLIPAEWRQTQAPTAPQAPVPAAPKSTPTQLVAINPMAPQVVAAPGQIAPLRRRAADRRDSVECEVCMTEFQEFYSSRHWKTKRHYTALRSAAIEKRYCSLQCRTHLPRCWVPIEQQRAERQRCQIVVQSIAVCSICGGLIVP